MKDKRLYSVMMAKAEKVVFDLAPHCDRIEIAGSLRRKCEMIGDIEIVCIPKPFETGLFTSGITIIIDQLPCVKGRLEKHCKYTQRLLTGGTKLDVFFAEPGNWGSILAIRTGSADFSKLMLATSWVKAGYRSEGGYLYKGEERFEVREERDLFEMIGLAWTEPEMRSL